MRRIDLQPPGGRRWQRWLTDCSKATAELIEQVAAGHDPIVKDIYKRKSIREFFFFCKGPPFYGKCAYCEAPLPDFQHGDVEHFRPKLGVTDEHNEPVFLLDGDGTIIHDENDRPVVHPGYYWLAYEWTNLLPACVKCNQRSTIGTRRIGKRNRFPVKGRHAQAAGEVAEEQPLLINPASSCSVDDPARHLRVDPASGLMIPLSERGEMSVGVLGLNLRDQLVDDRKRAIHQARYLLAQLALPGEDHKQAIQELLDITAGKRSYTMAQLAVIDEWRRGIAPLLEL